MIDDTDIIAALHALDARLMEVERILRGWRKVPVDSSDSGAPLVSSDTRCEHLCGGLVRCSRAKQIGAYCTQHARMNGCDCRECHQYPDANGGLCEGCWEYREHLR